MVETQLATSLRFARGCISNVDACEAMFLLSVELDLSKRSTFSEGAR
jgi:hypothetical protein